MRRCSTKRRETAETRHLWRNTAKVIILLSRGNEERAKRSVISCHPLVKLRQLAQVEVEVIRNHFTDVKPSERSSFVHPHQLKVKEVDRLHKHLPLSLEHAVSNVENHGRDAVDRLGLGLMTSNVSSDGASASASASPPASPENRTRQTDVVENERTNLGAEDLGTEEDGFEDIDSVADERVSSGRKKPRLPTIKIGTGKRQGLRQLFGRRRKETSPSPSAAEEGRVPSNPSLLSPPERSATRAQPKPIPMTAETDQMSPDESDRGISLTRTMSAPRNTSIRFAADSLPSSGSAPGISNYGVNNPEFRRNPALAMTRTTSVQSTGSQQGDGPSVSFKEPDKRR